MLCRWYYVDDTFRSENAIRQSSWGKQEEKLPINCENIGCMVLVTIVTNNRKCGSGIEWCIEIGKDVVWEYH